MRYNRWRYETGQFLHDNSHKLGQLSQKLHAGLFKDLCSRLTRCSPNGLGPGELTNDVFDIVSKLLDFCDFIGRAEANYVAITLDGSYPVHPKHMIPFDEAEMQYRAMTDPRVTVVDLLVTPGLARRGNANGNNYGEEVCIRKSAVAY